MSEIIQVTVSGSVGKQVFKTSSSVKIPGGEVGSAQPVHLKAIFLTPSGANATVTVRQGNASGTVAFFGRAPSAIGTLPFEFDDDIPFTRGMHVKVTGAAATAYLLFE